jgi:hypothetical protein
MHVICKKCGVGIEIDVTYSGTDTYRWGTNDMGLVASACHEMEDLPQRPLHAELYNCRNLRETIDRMVFPART